MLKVLVELSFRLILSLAAASAIVVLTDNVYLSVAIFYLLAYFAMDDIILKEYKEYLLSLREEIVNAHHKPQRTNPEPSDCETSLGSISVAFSKQHPSWGVWKQPVKSNSQRKQG